MMKSSLTHELMFIIPHIFIPGRYINVMLLLEETISSNESKCKYFLTFNFNNFLKPFLPYTVAAYL